MITIMYDDNVERVTIRYHYHYQKIIGLGTYLPTSVTYFFVYFTYEDNFANVV